MIRTSWGKDFTRHSPLCNNTERRNFLAGVSSQRCSCVASVLGEEHHRSSPRARPDPLHRKVTGVGESHLQQQV